ncbi:hypothetical protein IQ260_21450 [Leptolyngbya cf. ectocarpi LEGE 11479]|uniref:Branched-chain amino acid ATP-binding cassette transporter C-terminal domain-containing protein n=1 Tax=Leptolyngbya cf. ectocarpi LEGE 11479 TaxID=1828722 RepID=A0A929F8C5_LEPEC|nr:hypothetical protein [Leptolyngbya ectocarpi]MBE9069215.1 hypothetical protein [Leptolyngbya cf. ectocarpi LEGE 11479]
MIAAFRDRNGEVVAHGRTNDELSLSLAPQLVESLYGTLADLRREGLTILLVDQMASLALAIADRAYLLETGQIVRSGTAKELRDDPTIVESYLGANTRTENLEERAS